jgi:hypothetical protein
MSFANEYMETVYLNIGISLIISGTANPIVSSILSNASSVIFCIISLLKIDSAIESDILKSGILFTPSSILIINAQSLLNSNYIFST